MKKCFNLAIYPSYNFKPLFLGLAFVLNATVATAQSYDPLTLSKKIFSKDSLPDLSKYSTGEYKGHPNGQELATDLKTTCTLIGQNDSTAVVNISVSNKNGRTIDAYMHFRKDTLWKAAAFRALALTGDIEEVNYELKTLTPGQVDRIIALSHQPGNNEKIFSSREEYQYMLNNTGLILASDQELIAHFNKNKSAFVKLKNAILQKNTLASINSTDALQGSVAVIAQVKALWLTEVTPDTENNNLNFLIGGVTDNTVGYLYVSDEKNVPKMSPGKYIMIRSLGAGWYLFKTT